MSLFYKGIRMWFIQQCFWIWGSKDILKVHPYHLLHITQFINLCEWIMAIYKMLNCTFDWNFKIIKCHLVNTCKRGYFIAYCCIQQVKSGYRYLQHDWGLVCRPYFPQLNKTGCISLSHDENRWKLIFSLLLDRCLVANSSIKI